MTTQTTTTRRTRKDLEYLADGYTTFGGGFGGDDAKRNSRLIDHGWVTSQGSVSANGERIAAVVSTMRDRDTFDTTVSIMGLNDFVDAAIDAPAEDAIAYFAGLRTAYNLIDEARNDAGTDDVEFDGIDGHFAHYDARRGTVELRFESKKTASKFRREWAPERFDVEHKHDERFNTNRNPRRLVVTVA